MKRLFNDVLPLGAGLCLSLAALLDLLQNMAITDRALLLFIAATVVHTAWRVEKWDE